MNAYVQRFGRSPALFIVVHAENADQARRNALRARRAGADGLFLINHDIDEAALVACYDAVRADHADWWIGLCFLRRPAQEALDLTLASASGLWTGDAGIALDGADPTHGARTFAERRRERRDWRGLYFGGVAFKHERPVEDPAEAARLAAPYVDIVTTSGPATGAPAPVEKISAMRAALGDRPLAIASGITTDNVAQYLGLADCFLVSTGVSDSPSEISASKTGALKQIMRGSVGS